MSSCTIYMVTSNQPRQCANCPGRLTKKQLRFCSRECEVAFRRRGLSRNCRVCNKEFWRQGSVFCSRACRKEYYATRTCKRCPRCKEDKPLDQFKFSYCGKCFGERDVEKMVTPKFRWQCGKATAKKRGLEWDIPFEVYPALLNERCRYCGKELDPTGVGLDRKDSGKGYYLDNVVPCCGRCNRVKSDIFSYEEMLKLGLVIQDIDESRLRRSE